MPPARSWRSTSNDAGSHDSLPKKTWGPGPQERQDKVDTICTVPLDCGTPTTCRLYPFGAPLLYPIHHHINYLFIIHFPIGLDFLFTTFFLHVFLSWTASMSISRSAMSVSTLSNPVVCLPRPMEGMGRLQFSDLFTELSVPPQETGVVGNHFLTMSFFVVQSVFCLQLYTLHPVLVTFLHHMTIHTIPAYHF